VELVAQKSDIEVERNDPCFSPFEELTEKQRDALKLAYEHGFFETPRGKTGQEIAELMNITGATFHQHIRAAQKRIFDRIVGNNSNYR